ncbi:multidrug transporter subunit MdtN [Bordetella genomosp. 12]|uniref:Multidrug transporter subunit MdtN n=1 Tax=Bordetella genomosp. 12 TaxID=463035 RepID=A0A261VAR1_9BORD|nr:multidrug transporter subunit MdtN [Bordetella genomosp. 12]OZI70907.1 multidrug transporter subunit MdtN [Bordetella genomosp. 12]
MPPAPTEHGHSRRFAVLLMLVCLALAIGLGWAYFARIAARPLSEEAVITANVARMAPSVPGRLDQLSVHENDAVKKGQLLFTIDPEFYRLQLEQARAGVQAAEAALSTRRRSVSAETSNAAIAAEQVERARINLAQTSSTLQRLLGLQPKGYVTTQQVEDARTLKRNAETSLKEALAQQEAAKSLVGDTEGAQALVSEAHARLAIAQRQLNDTEVRAPNDGRVAGMSAANGNYFLPGQSAFSLIDTTRWWASATFLETELDAIKPGTCARVYVAQDRSRPISGVVDSMGWGVASEDLIPIPRSLPYVPKSLNWVRVGQRFPVRILLKDPPAELMRMGASATVIINPDEKC